MIIVTGSIIAREGCLDELIELSLDHVRRSRSEPGCLLHGVHADIENPLRLVFVEKWADRGALEAHFALQASRDFVRSARKLAAHLPVMEIFEADVLQIQAI
jgi:quinol monooxygenase YgiN